MNHRFSPNLYVVLLALSSACTGGSGPGDNNFVGDGGTDTDSGVEGEADASIITCEPTAADESDCNDDLDNDCDGMTDCESPDCSADDACTTPVSGCGEASLAPAPVLIPDGDGLSYETTVSVTGFDSGQTLQSADSFIEVCVIMEHSWLRDLQIELVCPSLETLVLQSYLGTKGGEVIMGAPVDESGPNSVPGTGAKFCWTSNAANPSMLDYANANLVDVSLLPAGDYLPSGSANTLLGCALNGDWKLRATDNWEIDDGFIFEWTLRFDQAIVSDCSSWND